LFTAGLDKTLRFFQIDGKTNPKVHGIHCKNIFIYRQLKFYLYIDYQTDFFTLIFYPSLAVPDMPIMSASYLGPEGSAVVLSGRRSYFYVCDVASGNVTKIPRIMHRPEKSLERMITSPCGKYIVFIGYDGHAILVDGSTRHLASTIKMNGSCRAVSFSPCGTYLFSSGSDGDVYQWDIRKTTGSIPKCVRRISNEDGTIVQSLALSDQFLAVGAESGVVNMFPTPCTSNPDFSCNDSYFSSSSTKPVAPLKRLMNLHTCATGLKFNHDGQILA
jgi:U3 small nucleolar RNA-associated protein 18